MAAGLNGQTLFEITDRYNCAAIFFQTVLVKPVLENGLEQS